MQLSDQVSENTNSLHLLVTKQINFKINLYSIGAQTTAERSGLLRIRKQGNYMIVFSWEQFIGEAKSACGDVWLCLANLLP